jgi:hypothetical protein
MFFKGSRYEKVETDRITNAAGQVVRFKKVRFIPDTPAQAAVIVNQGERLDHIAQRVFQDSELFWRIADANFGLWPPDLVATSGRVLKVPPAEG